MGGGRFNARVYHDNAAKYAKQKKDEIFKQSNLATEFDPLKITARESCASKEHPDPTSIIITCDVTGSMGKIPEDLIKGGLGKIMESLMKIKAISNPQVMFAAVGDTDHDKAPLQVTQFESDNRIEEQLRKLYLEGGGGGNNAESYHVIWYFAAHKTRLDCLKAGKKGILFTIGDELVPSVLKADHIRKFIDKNYKGSDILTSQLIRDVSEKYEVFHIVVQDTATYKRLNQEIDRCWKEHLGERAVLVSDYKQIPEKIIATIASLCEQKTNIVSPVKSKAEKDDTSQSETSSVSSAISASPLSQVGMFVSKTVVNQVQSSADKLNKDSDGTPHLFLCPISHEVMEDPVIAEDGFTYERTEIAKHFEKAVTAKSPKTNEIIGKLLIPNKDLRSEIIRWKEQQAAQKSVLSK